MAMTAIVNLRGNIMETSYSIRDRARAALVMLFFAMAASSASAKAAGIDRYVNAVGGIDSGSCSVSASPCLSIAYAISQAANDDTIHIAAGTYVDPLTINKQGLKLVGQNPANKPVITRYAGVANQALLVIIGVKNVEVRDLEFHMNQTFVAKGCSLAGLLAA